MRATRSSWVRQGFAIGLLAIPLSIVLSLPSGPGRGSPAEAAPRGKVLMAWGVGGVLTDDGTLWQFRPESRRWVTVDQSFALDGERRSVLPIPVPADQVANMQGFGFLITKDGSAWLYNLDSNKWDNLGAPAR